MILVVDPGIRGCGCALFDSKGTTLIRASYVKNPEGPDSDQAQRVYAMGKEVMYWEKGDGYTPNRLAEVVYEWPKIYTASRQKGDPNDLPHLVGVGASVAAFAAPVSVFSYHPDEWKGQMPKEVCHQRIVSRLSPTELAAIEHVGAMDHNTMDAIGIGLHHVGRFNRKRVFARGEK